MRSSVGFLMSVSLLAVLVAPGAGLAETELKTVAWGDNGWGQCGVPAPNDGFEALAGGQEHSLGLRSDGSIAAWGRNTEGQCDVPAPNQGFIAITAGQLFSLGLRSDSSIVAWGNNEWGQSSVPVPSSGFTAVAAGGYHGLGLRSDGSIVAWGRNDFGQCNVPAPNAGFVAVAAGGYHSLGLRSNGSIVAWGRNDFGQCIVPEPDSGFVAIDGGDLFTLGLESDGSIVGWGYNPDGECNIPEPNENFVAISAGYHHSLGLKSDGSAVAWGACYASYGSLCSIPGPSQAFITLAAGYSHSLAVGQYQFGGPNAGGVLIVHDTGVQCTNDQSGSPPTIPPTSCATVDTLREEVTDLSIAWKVYAAFPNSSSPRLSGVLWGVDTDTNSGLGAGLDIRRWGLPDPANDEQVIWGDWPRATGTSIEVRFPASPKLTQITEIYWFCGSGYLGMDQAPAFFSVVAHPSLPFFYDDSTPPRLDPITGYGSLGFGAPGTAPCPEGEAPPSGSCCANNGSCTMTWQVDCPGTWTDGSTCSPNPCAQPDGACCRPDGSCIVAPLADCGLPSTWTMFGGCAPNPCPQPGACCHPNGTCTLVLQISCTDTWDGSPSCDPSPCPLPPPHFTAAHQGNPYLPMNINALTATLLGTDLQAGDEIGIFDGSCCVGSALLTGPVNLENMLFMVASADDPSTPEVDGFVEGNAITLKVWDLSALWEYQATAHFWSAPGVPADSLFSELGTTYADIMGHSHFIPPFAGEPYLAMNVNILQATLSEVDMAVGDEIGIFDGTVCVGTALVDHTITPSAMLYMAASADNPGTPAVDGFVEGHPITFRLWDASAGEEHSASADFYIAPGVPTTGTFQQLGTVNAEIFSTIPQQIDLSSGWNIMSFNVTPETPDLLTVVTPVLGSLTRIVDEAGRAIFFNQFSQQWVNNIGNADIREGYYIRMSEAALLGLNGVPVADPVSVPLTLSWNIIGFPCYESRNAEAVVSALISAGYLVKVMDEEGRALFYNAFTGLWVNNIGNMKPGEGYYLKVNQDCSLVYGGSVKVMLAAGGGAGAAVVDPRASRGGALVPTVHFQVDYTGNPYLPMLVNALTVRVGGSDLGDGDEVALFDGSMCVGAGTLTGVVDPAHVLTMPAGSDDPETPAIDGFTPGHPIVIKIWDASANAEYLAEGDFWSAPEVPGDSTYVRQGFVYVDIAAAVAEVPGEGGLPGLVSAADLVCSNPLRPGGEIRFSLPSARADVQLFVADVTGRIVRALSQGSSSAGVHRLHWDGRDDRGELVGTGVYIVRLEATGVRVSRKVVVLRA